MALVIYLMMMIWIDYPKKINLQSCVSDLAFLKRSLKSFYTLALEQKFLLQYSY